jgi:hypothetical protein
MTHVAYSFVRLQLEVDSIHCVRNGVSFNMGMGEIDIMVQLSCTPINIQIVLHVQSASQCNCSVPCCGRTQHSTCISGELVLQYGEEPSIFQYFAPNEGESQMQSLPNTYVYRLCIF